MKCFGRMSKRGEGDEGGISFFAVRLKVLGALRAWEGGLEYCKLPVASRSEECVFGCMLMCGYICGGSEGWGRLGKI